MRKLLNGIKLFGGILPVLKALMELVEVPGKGEKKREAVLGFLKELWGWADEQVNDVLPDWKHVKRLFSTLIDLVVELWNIVGKFTHNKE